MSKVLRIHRGASETISDWGRSQNLGSRDIESIEDPIGATDRKEITSIPSPFARIDLAKRAFHFVSNHNLDGDTAFHKIVSDCLDVGQIFFNIDRYGNLIDIIEWDKRSALNELETADNEAHKRLGRTLKTYLEQDGTTYNFDRFDRMYLLNYKNGPNTMNIIGATSPATIFFTPANNMDYVRQRINFGNDDPFDNEYKPLYKRDEEYIKYWWSIKNSWNDFRGKFPEINEYLERNFAKFPDSVKNELRNKAGNPDFYSSEFMELELAGSQTSVKLFDNLIRVRKSVTHIDSDFEIAATRRIADLQKPLVLPIQKFDANLRYVIAAWDSKTTVEFFNPLPLEERVLPNDGTKYPYLTAGDFFADKIIKIGNIGDFDNDNYVGFASEYSPSGYLLPLKRSFFNYFSVADLNEERYGKKLFEIREMVGVDGNNVRVTLRIPIKGRKLIEYSRLYLKSQITEISEGQDTEGTMLQKSVSIGILPCYEYPHGVQPYYSVVLIDRNTVNRNAKSRLTLSFYDENNNKVNEEKVIHRNRRAAGARIDTSLIDTATYILNKKFKYMVLTDSDNDVENIIVPRFKTAGGTHKFRFAIDFGTTNTHIEYSGDGETSRSFDISALDRQILYMHKTDNDDADTYAVDMYRSDFVPEQVGDAEFYFPMRSALCQWSDCDMEDNHVKYPFGETNPSFSYCKKVQYTYNHVDVNLKWSNSNREWKQAEQYIESLLLLIRNKVLLNLGDLSSTEIVWFYPASITTARYNIFKQLWDNTFRRLFGNDGHIYGVSESIAPFYYYKAHQGAIGTTLTIDIGGGTTDVMVAKEGHPEFITSFRFAGNNVFGDGYSHMAETNEVINAYYDEVNTITGKELSEILNDLRNTGGSTEIISFLFSLKENNSLKQSNINFDFTEKLRNNNRAKFSVLIFYSALIFHIARLLKIKGIDIPGHLAFSGNGSKMLDILFLNNEVLRDFTKLIFEKVYGNANYGRLSDLAIIREDCSKESTCKGGLNMNVTQENIDFSQIKNSLITLLGTDAETICTNNDRYSVIFVDKKVKDEIKNKVVANVEYFLDFISALDKEFSFYDKFSIDTETTRLILKNCQKNLDHYLNEGIRLKVADIKKEGADDTIEETLFFYPINGMINDNINRMKIEK